MPSNFLSFSAHPITRKVSRVAAGYFDPIGIAVREIARVGALAHDAFQVQLASAFPDRRPVALKMFAELDRPIHALQQLFPHALAVKEQHVAQIEAAKIEHIEDVVDEACGAALYLQFFLESMEIGSAFGRLYDDLAVGIMERSVSDPIAFTMWDSRSLQSFPRRVRKRTLRWTWH
jgi:hypothetical protein